MKRIFQRKVYLQMGRLKVGIAITVIKISIFHKFNKSNPLLALYDWQNISENSVSRFWSLCPIQFMFSHSDMPKYLFKGSNHLGSLFAVSSITLSHTNAIFSVGPNSICYGKLFAWCGFNCLNLLKRCRKRLAILCPKPFFYQSRHLILLSTAADLNITSSLPWKVSQEC